MAATACWPLNGLSCTSTVYVGLLHWILVGVQQDIFPSLIRHPSLTHSRPSTSTSNPSSLAALHPRLQALQPSPVDVYSSRHCHRRRRLPKYSSLQHPFEPTPDALSAVFRSCPSSIVPDLTRPLATPRNAPLPANSRPNALFIRRFAPSTTEIDRSSSIHRDLSRSSATTCMWSL